MKATFSWRERNCCSCQRKNWERTEKTWRQPVQWGSLRSLQVARSAGCCCLRSSPGASLQHSVCPDLPTNLHRLCWVRLVCRGSGRRCSRVRLALLEPSFAGVAAPLDRSTFSLHSPTALTVAATGPLRHIRPSIERVFDRPLPLLSARYQFEDPDRSASSPLIRTLPTPLVSHLDLLSFQWVTVNLDLLDGELDLRNCCCCDFLVDGANPPKGFQNLFLMKSKFWRKFSISYGFSYCQSQAAQNKYVSTGVEWSSILLDKIR